MMMLDRQHMHRLSCCYCGLLKVGVPCPGWLCLPGVAAELHMRVGVWELAGWSALLTEI
jgi:hypothetical protein